VTRAMMMKKRLHAMKTTMNTRQLQMIMGNAEDHDRDLVPDRVQTLRVTMMP
jgi:hypothetical protein